MMDRETSPSEGEILDSDPPTDDNKKATKPLSSGKGTHVDRHSRKHDSKSRSPTPTTSTYSRSSHRNHRSRSRSPYRAPRATADKRRRDVDEDHYVKDNDKRDRRTFKVHYEDSESDHSRRSRDYNGHSRGNDRHLDPRRRKRFRTRSRSPPKSSNRPGEGDVDKHKRQPDKESGVLKDLLVSKRVATQDAEIVSSANTENHRREKSVSFRVDTKEPSNGVHVGSEDANAVPVEAELVSEAELIEQRRKRREAIKAKHRSQTSLLVQVLDPGISATPEDSTPSSPGTLSITESIDSMKVIPGTPEELSMPNSPAPLDVGDLSNHHAQPNDAQGEASAADYDPTQDMRDDRLREDTRNHANEVSAQAYDETKNNDQDLLVPTGVIKVSATDDGDFDMFADNADDMFADVPLSVATTKAVPISKAAVDMSMLDDWDDEDGYYKIIIGELLDNRYHVQMNLGRGMFSAVVRATDQTNNQIVAIKIIRSNDTMRKAALKEIDILGTLKAADREDKKHIIRLERQFEHKGHLCMVFENLSINLREVLKKFGRDVGINLRAVRLYAHQMFLGLSLLRKCNIIHADLKPDNILVNESRNFLKICDLGSASDASENEITPYLVSRFYRAPEIILGLPYDFAIDTWSVGCTLYELFTGKILFTGRNNNQMLRSIMECRGKFSHKILRKAEFAPMHFDDLLNFRSMEKDKISGKDVIKMYTFSGKPVRELKSRIMASSGSEGTISESEAKETALFVDLLDKCLALNPEKRITPLEAMKHPFIMRQK